MSYPPVGPGEPPRPEDDPWSKQPSYGDDPTAPPPPPPPAPPTPPTTWQSPSAAYPPPEPPEPPTRIQPPTPPGTYPPPVAPPPYGQPTAPHGQPSAPPYQSYPTSGAPGAYPPPPGTYPPPPGTFPPPPGAGPVPVKKSNKTLIIVLSIVGALILLCCIGGAVGFFALRNQAEAIVDDVDVIAPSPRLPDNNSSGPVTAPAGGTGANFDLAVGKTATISDEDGSFTLTLNSSKWFPKNCESNSIFPPAKGKILVLDVTFEVKTGKASVNPLFFDFVGSDGKKADFAFFSGCDDPLLDSDNDLPKGTKRSGQFAFDVTGSQTGKLQYDNAFELAASWKINA